MRKTIRLLFTFYRNFLILSLLITFGCVFIYWLHGIATFTALFWSKLITFGVIYFVINSSKSNEFYYYQNLGISKRMLWTATFSFDLIIFIFLIFITHHIR